jgi:hypothetical protein
MAPRGHHVYAHVQEDSVASTRRAQILMDPEEYEQLERVARERRTSVGELVRVAVRKEYLTSRDERMRAVERIAAMELPVGDWDEMKREIEDAYDAGLP